MLRESTTTQATPATPPAPAVDAFFVAELLTVMRCPTCGETFAVRGERASDAGRLVHCPSGHAFTSPQALAIDPTPARTYRELRQAKADAEQLRTLLALLPPSPAAGPCDDVEFKRRVNVALGRAVAEHKGGRFACRFCGRTYKRKGYLRDHLREHHEQLIRTSPAVNFC